MKRIEVLEVLKKVKAGSTHSKVIEGMAYLFFSGKNVSTFNDVISIQYPFKTDFSLFVKADDIFNVLSKSSVDEIELKENKGKLNIKAKGINVNLVSLNDNEVMERLSTISKAIKKIKEWKTLPDNFCNCISLCAFATDKDGDKTISCVRVNGDIAIATDNERVAKAVIDGKVDPMFIKASEINKLSAMNPKKYAISKAWIHFKSADGCVFSIRRVNGDFPDMLSVFEFKGTKVTIPKKALEGTEIASSLVDSISPAIKVTIQKGFMIISVKSESGSSTHKSKLKYSGKTIEFTLNPLFLKEMLAKSTTIDITEGKAKLETENFSLVTSLYGV